MASETPSLLTALEAIHGTGRFHATGSQNFVFPGIALPDGQELSFPLPRAQAKAIKHHAEPSPYGKGAETIHDVSVRKCWQLDTSELTWTPEWTKVIDKIARSAATDLGVTGKIEAKPYKLLLYEKGGFFLPHRDTEKLKAMFATLIVALPSSHSGGELRIRHDGQEVSVDFSTEEGRHQIQYAAFFADCEHEVKPVKAGYRLCLVYNLVLERGKTLNLNLPVSQQSASLRPHLKALRESTPNDLYAIVLEHQYTPANLSWRGLKGHDQARAKALIGAAKEEGFIAHLALISLYQMGQLEDDYDFYYEDRRRNRGRHSSDRNGSMGEIFEETLSIDEWRTPADRKVSLGAYVIHPDQIIAQDAMDSGDPDEQEEEGYTGNAGCTMEYWYYRAAIVVWPKEANEVVLTKYNYRGAAEHLTILASKPTAAEKPAFLALGQALIAATEKRLCSDRDSPYRHQHDAKAALPLIAAIATAKSKSLFQQCQPTILPSILAVSDQTLWTKIIAAFGPEACEGFFAFEDREDLQTRANAFLHALAAMLKAKRLPEPAINLARLLPDLLSFPTDEKLWRTRDSASETLSPKARLHIAIAASHLLPTQSARERIAEKALGDRSLSHLRETLAPALLDKSHRKLFKEAHSIFPQLLACAIGQLETEVATPLNPYSDWQRPCNIQDRRQSEALEELRRFMLDPNAETHSFRYRESTRQELISYIREDRLDLDCRTIKRGSPHVLFCTKNDQSYQRSLIQRDEDKKLLADLKRHAPCKHLTNCLTSMNTEGSRGDKGSQTDRDRSL